MFKFSLDPVLALREKIEDNKKRELGEATMYQDMVYQEKVMLEVLQEETLNLTRQQGVNQVDISSIKLLNQYNNYMIQVIEDKDKELERAKEQVESKRQELLEAVKDRKILENLRSIYKENYDEEEKRAEQRILDDMVTYRFGNKGKR